MENGSAPDTYKLGVTTCDKRGKVMLPGSDAIFVTDGEIGKFTEYEDMLGFKVSRKQ